MALSGTELIEIIKPDAKGKPSAAATTLALSSLTSLPAGTTVNVTAARGNANQIANARPVAISALGGVGVNDTVEIITPINTAAGVSSLRQAVLASAVNAFVS